MPHGFSARIETEFTANPIELTDLYLQWSGKNVKVMLGQQKAQFPLDEENSNLNSGAITGGKQNGYLASLIWTPEASFRLMEQYTKLYYTDAVIPVAGNRAYSVDMVGLRGQMFF